MSAANAPREASATRATRLKLAIRGAVQGVGFRPFIFRLATELRLPGWVNNSPQGVFVEVEGGAGDLEIFLLRLEKEKPPRSFIQSLEATWLDPVNYSGFEIRPSETAGLRIALVLPDIATCSECIRDIFDPANRRYQYPFTNCTNCGPRFSIIEKLPYDRANTSMKEFAMCSQCRAEYEDPTNRRFHAQPNACPACGPHLELWNAAGQAVTNPGGEALLAAVAAIRSGKIVALKGLGGFQLLVAAHDEAAVQRLRELKHREEKPFALMFPSFESAQRACDISPLEERLLCGAEAPIVLLRRAHRKRNSQHVALLAPQIAPGNPNLGVMLPYTPLHHLLLSLLEVPVVTTSGNLSDEPICIDEREALERLNSIADLFLVHDRTIIRHVDDSIVRILAGRELVLRRARGYAPLPIVLGGAATGNTSTAQIPSILAVGAHLKNTIALAVSGQAFVSQHIGDLETDQANTAFRRVISDFEQLYETKPQVIVADAHPDYLSTKYAQELAAQANGLPYVSVQHHLAHVLSCMTENELRAPVLGLSWDGTGYGLDQTIWGGEFFIVSDDSWERVAYLRQFRLPGSDKAIKEPRRAAIGLLFELLGEAAFERMELAPVAAFSPGELRSLKRMLTQGINSPITSSIGRLFDAIASLVDQRQFVRFEGQAAMDLEFALEQVSTEEFYGLPFTAVQREFGGQHSVLVLDWAELVKSVLEDITNRVTIGIISAKFHNSLVESILAVARHFKQECVALSGGCFQNRYLTERAVHRLREEGFRPYWHQRVPPNDGGISLGQVAAVLRQNRMQAK